ncbi:MAG: DHA2 family efflux MFS transporter permease subunit [Alicyclobacillus sp.]|nr:DHA2 family efflux MFS transporter permease subunit [Alicyclobacillus sp.]
MSHPGTQSPNPAVHEPPIPARGLQFLIILTGVFMAVLDTSVVNVAIPKMQTELNANTNQIQWVLTAYMLVIGVLVPISGWLTERVGAKKLFIFALATFTLGSALCGAAWNLSSMIAFRILQAVGGGFMMPVAQALIYRLFPPNRIGLAMGLFGISIMAAPAFGPVLSGYFVEYASWRLIFYLNVPIGLAALPLAIWVMYEFPHQPPGRLDVWGFILSTAGFFGLLYGLNNVPDDGWNSGQVWGFLILGVVCLTALVWVEWRSDEPIIQLRVLRHSLFSMSLVISSLLSIVLFSGIFLIPLYLQNTLGYTALKTGLFMTPGALASAVVMPLAGRLLDKIGPRPLGITGLAIVTLSTLGFAQLTPNTPYAHLQVLYILRSLGISLTMMPVMTAGMNSIPRSVISQGSAISNTIRQVASSLGTAVLTSYVSTQSKLHMADLAQQVTPASPSGWQLNKLVNLLTSTGLPPATAHTLAVSLVATSLQTHSFVYAIDDCFWVSVALTVAALVFTLFFAQPKKTAPPAANQTAASAGALTLAE